MFSQIVLTLLFNYLLFISPVLGEVNHAPLVKGHIGVAERYFNRHLKVGNNYDLAKAELFLEKLHKDYTALKSDVYETELLQSIEIYLVDIEQARKNARKEVKEDKNSLLYTFKKYLIPEMEAIRDLIAKGADTKVIDGKVDHFLELYHVFHTAEAPRNRFKFDSTLYENAARLLGYKYSKTSQGPEANNLTAGEHLEFIAYCLKFNPGASTPLTQEQLEKIRGCGFDLSKLEPVKNPFFKNLTDEEKERRKYERMELFPGTDTTFKYEFMIYTGVGSPKFVVSYKRMENGELKKYTLKVKTGNEIHADPTSSMLGKLLGLNQDHGRHYKTMRVDLGDVSFETFQAQFHRKYRNGLRDLAPFVVDHSRKGDSSNWIIFRDVTVEIRDPEKIRLTPYDPWAWDLPNRREHRGILLWYAFIAARDLKPGNHTVKLIEKNGSYELEYSPQDVGISLAGQIDSRYPFTSAVDAEGKTVNFYRPTFLSWSDSHVKIHWADPGINRIKYGATTFNDLKWMARKIAKLSRADLAYALKIGGNPEPAIDLYLIKMAMRRNEMIKAFGLENEFPLWEVPDLSTYSPNQYIRNGLITVDGFPGHAHVQNTTAHTTLLRYAVSGALGASKELLEGLNKKLDGGLSIAENLQIADLSKSAFGKAFEFSSLSAGITYKIRRNIQLNNAQYADAPNNMGRYIVKDSITIGINIKGLKSFELTKYLPFELRPQATVYERTYEHMQVTSNWRQALKTPVKIFSYLFHALPQIGYELEQGDVYKIQDRVGFRVDATVDVNLTQSPFLALDMTAGVGYSYSRPIYIYRDDVGDLFVFRESRNKFSANFGLGFVGVDLPILSELPLLGVSYSYEWINQHSELYKFEIGSHQESTYHRQLQRQELESFFNGGNPAYYAKNKVLEVLADGHVEKFKADFLIFFHKASSNSFFKLSVKNEKGQKDFYRYNIQSQFFIGEQNLAKYVVKNPWIFTNTHRQWSINIELEEKNIETATAVLEFQDFRLKLSKPNLLNFIHNVSREFSPEDNKPLFMTEHLPSEEEVQTYFKIWSQMRVYVGIGKFITKMNNVNYQDLRRRILSQSRDLGLKLPRGFLYILKRGVNQIKSYKNLPGKQVKAVANMLKYINKQDKSIRLLREMVGEENIFVYGDILGIYPSFSRTQELEGSSSRRFSAKSWGQFDGMPPLRKFLKDNMVTPIYLHLLTDDISGEVFGTLPSTNVGPTI